MRNFHEKPEGSRLPAPVRFALTALLLVAAPARAEAPAEWVGHYYLSGIMEVGSELILRADGRYDWFMSYGAVDQTSAGKWTREGKEIVLVATPPVTDGALVRADPQAPWSSRAEQLAQDDAHEAAIQTVEAACPFIAGGPPASAMSPAPLMTDATEADKSAHSEALAKEASARKAYEAAAAAAKPETMDIVIAARQTWEDALYEVRATADIAKLAMPDLAPPVLPATCRVPERPDADKIPQERWIGGHAVVVGDPSRGIRFSDFAITFRYADGKTITRTTTPGGWAWVPKRLEQAVTLATLDWPKQPSVAQLPQENLAITIPDNMIQPLAIALDRLIEPPFLTMRLTIQGKALTGFGGRGRYERP
jgi:hypothetical protein